MTTLAAHLPRERVKWRRPTWGDWLRVWRDGIFYVKRSNAWPRIPPELSLD